MKTPFLISGLVVLAASWCPTAPGAETNLVGTVAPTPVLVTPGGDHQFLGRLYYRGDERPRRPRSAVVLNFMGLKCIPCRKELPHFLRVVRKAAKQSAESGARLRFFVVSTDPLSAKADLRKFLEAKKMDFQTEVLLDPYRKAAAKFGVKAIPRTVVISPQGRITADITGLGNDYADILRKGIETALKDVGRTGTRTKSEVKAHTSLPVEP